MKHTATLFDYLPSNNLIVQVGNIEQAAQDFWQQTQDRYDQYGHDLSRPILAPSRVFILPDQIFGLTKQSPQIKCVLQNNPELPSLQTLPEYIEGSANRILFCAESNGRKIILEELLAKQNIRPKLVTTWEQFITESSRFLFGDSCI